MNEVDNSKLEELMKIDVDNADIVVGVDESTMKTGIKTKKGIYFNDFKKTRKNNKRNNIQ